MTTSRRALLLLGFAVAAIVAALGAVSLASGTSAWEPTSHEAVKPALADARERLRSFQPPPGSRRVAALPKSLHLRRPGETVGSPNFFGVHAAFWVTADPVDSVRAYLSRHAPPGSRLESEGEWNIRHKTYRWDYGYSWPELPEVAYERRLLVGVVARPGGGSALRVDAQGVWLEPKPPTERIPGGAGLLEVVETLGDKTHRASTANTDKIEAVADLLNGFPVVQRLGPHTCTFIPSEQTILRAYFYAAPDGTVLAETEQNLPEASCQAIGITIGGEEQRPLVDENEALTKSLQKLLSHRFKTPLSKNVHF